MIDLLSFRKYAILIPVLRDLNAVKETVSEGMFVMTLRWMLCILFQIIGLIFALLAGLNKNKFWILALTLGANICSTLVMLLAGRYDGAAATVVGTVRSFLFLFQNKTSDHKIFWGCVSAHILVGILSWQSVLSLLIIIATVVLCYVNWFGDSLKIKYGSILSCTCWVIFDTASGIYIEAARDLAEIVSNVIGLKRIHEAKRKQITVS